MIMVSSVVLLLWGECCRHAGLCRATGSLQRIEFDAATANDRFETAQLRLLTMRGK
jgi:hypothetical protein